MSGRFYLGVDGGQSSTTALIADEEGRALGKGRGGPCNHVSGAEAVSKFRNVIGACVSEAARSAGLDPEDVCFSAACFGFSGGPADKEALVRSLVRSQVYKVTHDAEIALTGALSGQPGIIVISGTGSMAFGRDDMGRTARAGGWGYVFGDEGGAFDLVRRALRAALRSEERWGPDTILRDKLISATGAATADDLLHWFYTSEWPRSRVAALACVVSDAAEAGDLEAVRTVEASGAALAEYAAGVQHNLFGMQPAAVSYAGGTFASKPLLRAFETTVRERMHCSVTSPQKTPAEGAVIEALRL